MEQRTIMARLSLNFEQTDKLYIIMLSVSPSVGDLQHRTKFPPFDDIYKGMKALYYIKANGPSQLFGQEMRCAEISLQKPV